MSVPPKEQAAAAQAAWLRALERTAPIARNSNLIFPLVIDDCARKFGNAPALLGEHESWTHGMLADRANRYARWGLANGIARGEVVCLVLSTCPDYLAIWLGLTRIGAVVALVNTNLASDALARAVAMVAPRHIIVGGSLAGLLPRPAAGVRSWAHGPGASGLPRIDDEIDRTDGAPLAGTDRAPPSLADRALHIYTSGTTGFPRAANVSHRRIMEWTHWFAGMMDTGPGDRMYDCLPLYHGLGGIVATGAVLIGGGSVVLRPHFSASRFWDDVVGQDCTLFQYIGELCRYLVNSPHHPRETEHRLRLCCGNGLRADVWERFAARFRVPRILEFYAATEGTVSLYNCEGKPGALGRVPSYLAHRFPLALVPLDGDTGEPLRDPAGRALRCAAGEAGEAIGRIVQDRSGGGGRFEGYTDGDASSRKLLRDVFAPGDMWFRTGDLMRRDASGFFYFVDRVGDTFRWKGETVSTSEVAETLSACAGVLDAVVYGVRVGGTEGRAGMAAIVAAPGLDLAVVWRDLAARLPEYAMPLFLRIRSALDMTTTLRPVKQDLVRDGFDPDATADPLYFSDRAARRFVPLDPALYRRILDGAVRL